MPVDYTQPLGQVRLLISDTSDAPLLGDDEIVGFLLLEDTNVRLAAADALDAIAVSEVLVSKVISKAGLTTNGAAVAASLKARADSLRQQDAQSGDGGYFEIITPYDGNVVGWCC